MIKNLDAFVKAHYKLLTISDMAEELKCGADAVFRACEKLNLKAVTIKERNENFVLEFHTKKTAAQLARSLGVAEGYVKIMCKKLGIEPLKEKPVETVAEKPGETVAEKKTSALAGLSSFTMPDANHYTDLKGVKWGIFD